MPSDPINVALPQYNLGTEHTLRFYRYGEIGARPKVYVQAGIHADEVPAPLVAHQLVALLEEADARGDIAGNITVVPVANPVGLSQVLLSDHVGRHDLASGRNYNRFYPDVSAAVLEAVDGRLVEDMNANLEIVAEEIREAFSKVEPKSLAEALQLTLIQHACDCDIVLDLHTDSEAELHLYVDPDNWPGAQDLAAELQATVVMISQSAGGRPFEETAAAPWQAVRERFGSEAVPSPLATVIELRGYTDASNALATKDANALFRFLQRRGAVAGDPGTVPAFTGIAAPFEATDLIVSPANGVVVFKKDLGDTVGEGDVVAEIVDVSSNDASTCRTPVRTTTTGRLFTRCLTKLVRPGSHIAKVQGTEPLAHRTGYLLTD